MSKARYANADKRIRHMIDAREMTRRDALGRLHNARKEGKTEDARKMREKGFDADIIADITGLSKEQIERL